MVRHIYTQPEEIPDLLQRLTPRDRVLVDLLGRHSLLTIDQIQRLLFSSLRSTRYRIAHLLDWEILTRFRPLVRPGSEAYRYTLGYAGALIHAAATGRPRLTKSAYIDHLTRLAASPQGRHLLGVNDFFVRITACARTEPDLALTDWYAASEAAELTGGIVRPDAAATLTTRDRPQSFWFEHDTGTEPSHRLVAKAERYSANLAASGWPVLFELQGPRREQFLHQALEGRRWPLLLATTIASRAVDPTGSIWQLPNHPGLWRIDQFSLLDR